MASLRFGMARSGWIMAGSLLGVVAAASNGAADEAAGSSARRRLPEVTVTAEDTRPAPFLPDVSGARVLSGKKTAVIDLRARPTIINNNYRQALEQTPGLLVSEETTPLLSIGYRGLAPDRLQFMQVLKDGVPIQAELFGYPEAYYTPPFQTLDRIEFIHGGGSLLYGPQPGGTLNFITRTPDVTTPLAVTTEHAFGDDELFSHYTGLTGGRGPVGYLGYVHEREGNGFREANGGFEVLGSGMTATVGQASDSRWTLGYDEYHEEHGEPGGLTRAVADSEARDTTTRQHDRFRLERYYGTLRYERDVDEATRVELRTFGGHYRRYSKRQNGGGFGTAPTAAANSIQEQDFYTFGIEPRIRHLYDAFGQEGHAITAGVLAYFSDSPREDQTGSGPNVDTGVVTNRSDRTTQYLSLFAEHLFRFGPLSITPGVRLEHIWQHVKERVNTGKTTVPLGDVDEFDFVPLVGVGVAYALAPALTAYTNFSQGYRPKAFTQAVPTGATQVVNGDLEEGTSWVYDVGLRGQQAGLFAWDASYFLLRFDDQIGTAGNTVANVGDALHQGLEAAVWADLVGWYDRARGTDAAARWGSLSPFVNLMLLDASFIEGPQDGKRPQYAPQYTLRTGVRYAWRDRVQAHLSSLFVDDHFGDDASTAAQGVPSYKVWDLTGEAQVWPVRLAGAGEAPAAVSLLGGINNLFDERYFSRVTSGGIDPAPERNIYGGVRVRARF